MSKPRIYTRCPACHNDTLIINEGHLLCTWHKCPDPTAIENAVLAVAPVPGEGKHVQHFLNTWERRPRRQLDYSQLTNESLNDLEWTNDMLKAIIPAAREIADKFGLTPEAPIVIQMPPPESAAGAGSDLNGSEARKPGVNAPAGFKALGEVVLEQPATPSAQPPAQDASSPSTSQDAKPVKAPSSKRRRKGRRKTKKQTAKKFSTALEKAGVTIAPSPALEAPKVQGIDMTDPPAPSFTEIG